MSVDTSGQVTIRGEGSATTTNLQQGLAKAFINANQITAADSFNCSGTTDHGTGNYTYTLTNGFSNSNWVLTHEAGHDGVTMGFYIQDATTGRSSTLHRFELKGDGFTNQDSDLIQQAFFGDLA
jgi:hypothetical protein